MLLVGTKVPSAKWFLDVVHVKDPDGRRRSDEQILFTGPTRAHDGFVGPKRDGGSRGIFGGGRLALKVRRTTKLHVWCGVVVWGEVVEEEGRSMGPNFWLVDLPGV